MPENSVAPQYVIRQWTPADGLPSSRIQCLLQDREGYLWIGTRNGLARFDGSRFSVLPGVNCYCLAQGGDGALLAGTLNGLLCLRGDAVEQYRLQPERNGPYLDTVSSISACREGGFWVAGLENYLFRFEAGKVRQVKTNVFAGGAPLWAVHEDRAGRLWVGNGRGLRQWDREGREILNEDLVEIAGKRPADFHHTQCVFEDRSGAIWFGHGVHTLRRIEPGGSVHSMIGEDVGLILALSQDFAGTMWVGAQSGLWQARGEQLVRPAGLDGKSLSRISSLLHDREGNLWVGTENDGLYCLQPKLITTLTTQNGLANDDVWSIAESRDGSVWIGTAGGLTHLSLGQCENYTTDHGLATPCVRSVLEDHTGVVWAGTDFHGALHRFANGRFSRFGPQEGVASEDFSGISEDHQGRLWVTGGAGLHRYEDGRFTTIPLPDDKPGSPCAPRMAAFADRSGNLWIGGNYLVCLRDGRSTVYRPTGELPNGPFAVVREDGDALWVGSAKGGLIRFKDGKFTPITTARGLFSDLILSMQEDEAGNFWINCHQGIFHVRKQDLHDVADGRRPTLQCVAYGLEDGLLSAEGNGGAFPNSCKTRDGRLWFPTNKGVAIVDPRRAALDDRPPPVVIEELHANGEPLFNSSLESVAQAIITPAGPAATNFPALPRSPSRVELRLPPGRGRSLVFHYVANSLEAPEKIRFRFRLEGRDREWTQVGGQRSVHLEDLPPGHYKFHVTACSRHGVWNPEGAQVAFYLEPHLYQTWPFYIGCGMLTVLAAGGLQTYRLAAQRRVLSLQREATLARERERISRDMHDDLGASLTRIALLSEVACRQLPSGHEALEPMERISATARRVVDSLGELVWATNPKYDTLDSLAAYFREYTAQFFASADVECRLDFPQAVPALSLTAEFRRQMFLVLKEALHNVVRHAHATCVEVRLALAAGRLDLVVADDGKGFMPNDTPGFHHGMANMRQRIESLEGHFEIRSTPGQGTSICIRVPLPEVRH